MKSDYIELISSMDLSRYQYKILLALAIKKQTQSRLSKTLNIHNANLTKPIKGLLALHLIEVDRIEGRNKYYRLQPDIRLVKEIFEGQATLEGGDDL